MCAGFHLKSHGRKELWGKLGSQRPRVVCEVRTGRSLALGQPCSPPALYYGDLLFSILVAYSLFFWASPGCPPISVPLEEEQQGQGWPE